MKTDIEHIITFVHVFKAGSFSKAAEQLSISKSVVSKHISFLEHRLKTQLLLRSTRALQPTEEGVLFYQQVKDIPEQIQSAEQALSTRVNAPYGKLTVYAPMNIADSLKEKALPEFTYQHPDVTLDIQFVRPVIDHLKKQYDVIILWKLSPQSFPNYELVGTKLFSMNVDIYASPEYLKKHGEPKTPEDLKNHNCLSTAGRAWPLKTKTGTVVEHSVDGSVITNDDDVIKSLILAGQGISYSYPYIYQHELEQKKVIPIMREYTDIKVDVYAFYHPTQYLQPKVKCFIEHLKNYYQSIEHEIATRGQ